MDVVENDSYNRMLRRQESRNRIDGLDQSEGKRIWYSGVLDAPSLFSLEERYEVGSSA